MLHGSSIWNGCNQQFPYNYVKMIEGVEGDIATIGTGVKIVGKAESILRRIYETTDVSHCFKDTHDTLHDGKRTVDLELWIPVKRNTMRQDESKFFNYNLYFTVLMELGGTGEKTRSTETWGGYECSYKIYYKNR